MTNNKNTNKYILSGLGFSLLLCLQVNYVSAASNCELKTAKIGDLLGCARDTIIVPSINVILALALLVFFWGLVKYMYKGDNDAERTKGKNFMAFGIVGLFVMVSVWGLVGLLTGTFFGTSGPAGVNPPVPQLPAGVTT